MQTRILRAARPLILAGIIGCIVIGLCASSASAQSAEFRAYWADAFHSGFKTQAQCDQLVADVKASNCNAVVIQMRRRGDTYYPSSYEPFASDANTSFDALQYMINKCHSSSPRIQVHAWFVLLPVWNSQTYPSNPSHPINRYPQYLSKSNTGATWDGSNYWFDPGHPECEQYLNNVVMDVVNRYDVDGISFDYSRFDSRTWGYNTVSVSRFNAAYGRTGTPSYTDSAWSNWRRAQITNLIRKIYANAIAAKPNLLVSSAVVTWHPTPSEAGSFTGTQPYITCFQDWDSWMREGILDLSMPMCYFDKDGSYASDYDGWSNWSKSHQYARATVIGQGAYMNDISDTISQIRQTRTSSGGYTGKGVVMYSYAVTNDQGLSRSTFINALTKKTSYDPNPTPVFNTAVSVPTFWWKSSPVAGHIKGTVTNSSGNWLDGATISVTGPDYRSMTADGTGFYAFIDLAPGTYLVTASYPGQTSKSTNITVTAGTVKTANFTLGAPSGGEIIIDNTSASFSCSSNWSTGTSSTDKYGTNYRYRSTASVSDPATWTPNIPTSGYYSVYAWWPQGTNRSSAAPYIVNYSGGSQVIYVNQQINGGQWNPLGTFYFAAGTGGNVMLSCWTSASGVVMADAVRFVPE